MSDTLLLQQVYPGSPYIHMLDLTHDRHVEYCARHDIEYSVQVCGDMGEPGGWEKLRLVKNVLNRYKLIVWLDADAYIEDLTVDLRDVPNPKDTIGAAWFPVPTPHWNVGVLYFRPGPRVMKFLNKWLSLYPGEGRWREQQVFQVLGAKPHAPVFTVPDEWNSSLDHNWQPDRVISAFHGARNRLETMKHWLQESRDVIAK